MLMETALTLDEVAKLLKVSHRTVCQLATKGELPGRKIGNRWRFSPTAVQRWLAGEHVPKSVLPAPYPGGAETLPAIVEVIRLLLKLISEQQRDKPSESERFYGTSGVERKTGNIYLDFYGALASNPLAREVAAAVEAEKERQRQIAQSEDV